MIVRTPAVAQLAISIEGDEPPAEFRLFKAGWNDTENGRFLFDADAAASVMAAYEAHSVDCMIDLEHLSLDDTCPNYDPDARGWLALELRAGELWAVAVKWTADGARRLKEKLQRYISPTFWYDGATKRITKIVNIALTALPATHGCAELVAARAGWRSLSVGPSLDERRRAVMIAIEKLYPNGAPGAGGPAAYPYVLDVFEASAVYELAGKLFEVPYTFDGSSVTLGTPAEVVKKYVPLGTDGGAPATPPEAPAAARAQTRLGRLGAKTTMDPKQVQEAIEAIESGDADKCKEILKALLASAAGGEPANDPPTDEQPGAASDPAVVAASARLLRLTSKDSHVAALDEVERWKQSHLTLETEQARLARERDALETTERKTLVGTLVKLGAETPATAWSDATATAPCKRLADEPLADLRDRVGKLTQARGGKLPGGDFRPPPTAGATVVNGYELSEQEIAMCKKRGVKVEDYVQTRLGIRQRSTPNASH